MKTVHLLVASLALALLPLAAPVAEAADQKAIQEAIKSRQAAYQFMAWNMGRLKANVEPNATFNAEEVVKAANAIQAVANSGLGSLYIKGSDKGTGYGKTRAKSSAFDPANGKRLGELAGNFNREANAMATIAAGGNADAVRAQLGKLGETCKACHDDFRHK